MYDCSKDLDIVSTASWFTPVVAQNKYRMEKNTGTLLVTINLNAQVNSSLCGV